MNAQEYQVHLRERVASTPPDSLRAAMFSREGVDATDDAIRRGLKAWVVHRSNPASGVHDQDALVFGRCRSDAIRRAAAPARLGWPLYGDEHAAAPIVSGWDEPLEWPERLT